MSSDLIIIDCYGPGGRHVLRERQQVSASGSEFVIGRAMDADVSVEDAKLEARHFQLLVTPNQQLSIKRLSPTADVRINGKKAQDELTLLDGPVTVMAGRTRFEVRTSWDDAREDSQSHGMRRRLLNPLVFWALAAICLAMAQLTYSTWLETVSVSGFWESWFQGVLVLCAVVLIWSLAWASVGRLASGRWVFLVHVAIIAGMFGLNDTFSDLYTLAWFALGFSWDWYHLISLTFDLCALAVAFLISLYVATQLAPRVLVLIAVPALILGPVLVYWFGVHAQSKNVNWVQSEARIYPPGLSLSSRRSVTDFIGAARALKTESELKRDQLPAVDD